MCSERSGSNFITRLLNGHPEICGPAPKHLLNPLLRNVYRYGDLTVDHNWNALLEDVSNLLECGFTEWNTSFTIEELNNLSTDRRLAELVKGIYETEAKSLGKSLVFIKENHCHLYMENLINIFPDSSFVYLVRDPRDMALSWKKNRSIKGGVVQAATAWKDDQVNFSKYFNVLQQQNKGFFLSYEELVNETEVVLPNLCKFLKVDYCSTMLDFHEDELNIKNASKQDAWKNLSKAVMKGNTDKYKQELTNNEIRCIESILRYDMHFFGYSLVSHEDDLNMVTQACIENLNQVELSSLVEEQSEPVKAVNRAKTSFYQRRLDDINDNYLSKS